MAEFNFQKNSPENRQATSGCLPRMELSVSERIKEQLGIDDKSVAREKNIYALAKKYFSIDPERRKMLMQRLVPEDRRVIITALRESPKKLNRSVKLNAALEKNSKSIAYFESVCKHLKNREISETVKAAFVEFMSEKLEENRVITYGEYAEGFSDKLRPEVKKQFNACRFNQIENNFKKERSETKGKSGNKYNEIDKEEKLINGKFKLTLEALSKLELFRGGICKHRGKYYAIPITVAGKSCTCIVANQYAEAIYFIPRAIDRVSLADFENNKLAEKKQGAVTMNWTLPRFFDGSQMARESMLAKLITDINRKLQLDYKPKDTEFF